MNGFRSNNPVFKKVLNDQTYVGGDYQVATYGGVALKTLYFIGLLLAGVYLGFYLLANNPETLVNLLMPVLIATVIFSLLAIFIPKMTFVFGSIYCVGKGIIVGLISIVFEAEVSGVATIALLSTIVVLVVVATLFLTRIVVVTSSLLRFTIVLAISLTITILMISLLTPDAWMANSTLNYLVSALMVFLGTLYLLHDFESIRQVVEGRQLKVLEWYVSFGLIFTVIWVYMQMLRIALIILRKK